MIDYPRGASIPALIYRAAERTSALWKVGKGKRNDNGKIEDKG